MHVSTESLLHEGEKAARAVSLRRPSTSGWSAGDYLARSRELQIEVEVNAEWLAAVCDELMLLRASTDSELVRRHTEHVQRLELQLAARSAREADARAYVAACAKAKKWRRELRACQSALRERNREIGHLHDDIDIWKSFASAYRKFAEEAAKRSRAGKEAT